MKEVLIYNDDFKLIASKAEDLDLSMAEVVSMLTEYIHEID